MRPPRHLLIRGDARRIPLADGVVQCVATSPPYFGLRDYGVAGQLGLERTPEEYVAAMVAVFREVRRVLRPDGTLWLNLGDSYNSDTKWGGSSSNKNEPKVGYPRPSERRQSGCKAKDLIGIPWMVAFALRADGWYLRSDVIWHKPNPMPESVTDRPTKAHEYLFLLTKGERYHYDADAIREPVTSSGGASFGKQNHDATGTGAQSRRLADPSERNHPLGRNKRSVWTVATRPFPGAHFATFPPDLIEPCIKAGTSEKGCCSACGTPWVRVVERTPGDTEAADRPKRTAGMDSPRSTLSLSGNGSKEWAERGSKSITLGWEPSCDCDAPAIPCLALDPFNGSGTTGQVALGLGCDYAGLDLNPDYLGLSRQRITRPHARPVASAVEGDPGPSLFALFDTPGDSPR